SLVSAGLLTAQTLVLNSGLWLTKAVLPGPDAGYYRAASLLAQIPISISAGLVWGLYASYAEAHRRGDSERMRHYIGQSFRVLVAAAGLWIAAVVPTANALMVTVFKEAYAPGAPLLAFLAFGAGIGAVAVTFGPVLLIEGRGRAVIITCVLLIAAEVAAAIALMDSMGATGVAIAAAAVFVTASALAFVAVRGRIGYSVLGMLARFTLPSALVFTGALLVKPQPGLPLIGWYVLLSAAYAGLCLLTRGFTAEDVVAFRHGLR
ncbi:MAG: hypothetical protein HY876_03120, partial [Coriobacteriales bacterium]|nr:hypothetical protein [Coriobacteriales bacterium]